MWLHRTTVVWGFSWIFACIGVLTNTIIVQACACCTNPGQRTVLTKKLTHYQLDELKKIRFSSIAKLYVDEGNQEYLEGISLTSEQYEIKVTQSKDRWAFDFRDKDGRSGSLFLIQPSTVSMFEIDPRSPTTGSGNGPQLYKEWKLTSPVSGTNIFSAGMGSGQNITLILQGHGNSCTSSDDFTHWTLVVYGPKSEYTFFGELLSEPH